MATPEIRAYGSKMAPIMDAFVSVNTDFQAAAVDGSQLRFESSERLLRTCAQRLDDLDKRLKPIRPPRAFAAAHAEQLTALNTYRQAVNEVYRAAIARDGTAMGAAVLTCKRAEEQVTQAVAHVRRVVQQHL